MTYYDPHIYNFANLNEIDRANLSTLLWHLCEIIPNFSDTYSDCEYESLNYLVNEIRDSVLLELINNSRNHIIETVVSLIDGDENDVEYRDTTDYFYGCNNYKILQNNDIYKIFIKK